MQVFHNNDWQIQVTLSKDHDISKLINGEKLEERIFHQIILSITPLHTSKKSPGVHYSLEYPYLDINLVPPYNPLNLDGKELKFEQLKKEFPFHYIKFKII